MKKSIAMKWIKALRSGKYKQTTSNLKNDIGHCCLGVLCTLTPYKNNYTKMNSEDGVVNKNSVIPPKVRDYAGLNSNHGKLPSGISLANLNDAGTTFKEIADLIEQNWEKL